jgi:hypothetical protein
LNNNDDDDDDDDNYKDLNYYTRDVLDYGVLLDNSFHSIAV